MPVGQDIPAEENQDAPSEPTSSSADALTLFKESAAAKRSPRVLPRLTRTAMGLAREASPRLFWLVIALSFASAAVLAAQVLLGKLAIESVLEQADGGGSVTAALPALIGLVAATAIGGVLTSGQALLQRLLGERVQRLMWGRILDVTTEVDLVTFEDPRFFDDLQRVRTNALIRPVTLSQGMVQLVAGLLAIVVLGVALVLIDPLLLAVLLVGGVPLFVLSRRTARLEFDFAVAQTPEMRLRSYLSDTLTGRDEAKEVRAFSLSGVLRERWGRNYDAFLSAYSGLVRKRMVLSLAGSAVTLVVTTAALALLLISVYDDRIALGSAGAALIAIRLLAGRIQQVFSGISQIFESALFLRDFHAFTERRPPVRTGDQASPKPASPREMRVDNVSFRYPGAAADALKGVSLTIRAGETIALVGENGSGKTTLAKILARVYDPTGGDLLWDGQDATAFDDDAARSHIGVIFQDYLRYQLSVRENIAFGRATIDPEETLVARAASRAGADRFISRLPAGYETGLGKEFLGGHDLSGGQWQRIAIARAFYRDADFLVLDEPTASLDARSENEVFDHVRTLATGRSLLLISHRFSTVRAADRIYVLHEGELVEHGSHDELVALGGRYAELFELQARSYR